MKDTSGMGIEVPVWVIQSANGKRVFNQQTNKFQTEITKECLYKSPTEAAEKLKMMDYGYVVNQKRHYRDVNNERIR